MFDMSDSARDSYEKVFSSLEKHHNWFENSIPLIASENIPSPAVREAVMSDFGNRYAEGWPGERVYASCTYIDELEFNKDSPKTIIGFSASLINFEIS